ncbi:MAG: four-carbon acid sugar kinase family protein [Achromobacter ruhlandii]|jgi:3-oxoisoapionate kinase|nr:four-carbon acid sugar kinase family protein [Achromobacter ruhlandii]MCI1835036.1 four-carbon acid sugar kinase family protein [Achromobacter ruhlandii]
MTEGPARAPCVAWYGDDFTGATDTLAHVALAGWRSLLFLGVPTPRQLERAGPLDAIGIAGAARGMAPDAMTAELRMAGRFLAATGARILHYKCCSTFDSAPHVGSIGAAVTELRRHVPNPLVPIVGGQPGIGRYCSFGNLFARAGAAPEIHRIDRHPVMRAHPVTPMAEADLRRHLASQGLADIASLPHTGYPPLRAPADLRAADEWIDAILDTADGPLLLDLVDDEQLPLIGRLLWRAASVLPLLAVGPSSVQQALTRAAGIGPALPPPALAPAEGPVLVVAGSLSPVTARQIAACQRYARQPLNVARLLGDAAYVHACIQDAAAALAQGRNVLMHTDAPDQALSPDRTAATARATGQLVAGIVHASAALGRKLSRLGIAGGDTSSQAALALGLWGLGFHGTLAPGVTVSVARGDDPLTDGLQLMLKGGQMGGDALFDDLVRGV